MTNQTSIKILRRPALCSKVGLQTSVVYDRLNPQSKRHDPLFPRPIKLGTGANPPVGWIESEVDEYLAVMIAKSRAPTETDGSGQITVEPPNLKRPAPTCKAENVRGE